ncbi:helix-turn-helix domain-containing protein [Nocardia salmonicida]|uniref:helix-turn-helix domain-containing protein n=1 Tax=Nocardia salmonicida TaxID=53431 RepID=UPI0007A4ACC6|nr:helix-turn-helix transcriptional regulator [Nocardia salmonicida]
MSSELDYRWHLRTLMAERGMFSTSDLKPKLAERGIQLSASQVYRLVVERPERLSLKTLVALMDILGCRMEELIEPVKTQAKQRKAVGSDSTASIGQFRPKRARIVNDER